MEVLGAVQHRVAKARPGARKLHLAGCSAQITMAEKVDSGGVQQEGEVSYMVGRGGLTADLVKAVELYHVDHPRSPSAAQRKTPHSSPPKTTNPSILSKGSFVELGNLSVRSELNGQKGVVLGIEPDESRFQIRLLDGIGPLSVGRGHIIFPLSGERPSPDTDQLTNFLRSSYSALEHVIQRSSSTATREADFQLWYSKLMNIATQKFEASDFISDKREALQAYIAKNEDDDLDTKTEQLTKMLSGMPEDFAGKVRDLLNKTPKSLDEWEKEQDHKKLHHADVVNVQNLSGGPMSASTNRDLQLMEKLVKKQSELNDRQVSKSKSSRQASVRRPQSSGGFDFALLQEARRYLNEMLMESQGGGGADKQKRGVPNPTYGLTNPK